MSRPVRIFTIAGLVLVAGILAGLFHAGPDDDSVALRARPSAYAADHGSASAPSAMPDTLRDSAPAQVQADLGTRFRESTNYLRFIESIRPAAEAGDSAASFFIYRALFICQREYLVFFLSRGRELSLDEGLQRAVARGEADIEFVRRMYGQCHDLRAANIADLKDSADWLRRSAEGGHPPGQAKYSWHRWRHHYGENWSDWQAETNRYARQLMGAALRSRHPEAIAVVADMTDAIVADEETQRDVSSAWWLAACQRGLACGPGSDLVQQMCRMTKDCQPYQSVRDVIEGFGVAAFPAIEARASRINELIDAGEWEELGFGETLESQD